MARPATQFRVYPRVYGGTCISCLTECKSRGLSPRVRGNHARLAAPHVRAGSIPACTGEPRTWPGIGWPRRVYPRVYGGTPDHVPPLHPVRGLSPRVRGNPLRGRLGMHRARSIPACTGEPCIRRPYSRSYGVYPRVYGGTTGARAAAGGQAGLSPRVRGNHVGRYPEPDQLGSIPACTGEPTSSSAEPSWNRVYPRVYGGTLAIGSGVLAGRGLSPRVRGNRG